MSESWEEFRARIATNVQKIRDTKDDGMYARLYAQDVGRILRMFSNQDDTWNSSPEAFDATCEE